MKYLGACLKSVEAQTRKPDMVIVGLSDVIDPTTIENPYPLLSVPIEFITSPETIHPGGNRNRAAAVAMARGADILAFFDSDDIMHPERLAKLENHLINHPEATGILHHFLIGQKKNMDIYDGTVSIPWQPLTGEYVKCPYTWYSSVGYIWPEFNKAFKKDTVENYGNSHNGHMTVRASYWKENPYFEGIGPFGYSEDSHFSAGILQKGLELAYTPDILSLYQRVEFGDEFHIGFPFK